MGFQPVDLGDRELNREVNMMLALEDDSPMLWWWLSFCDTERPEGTQFLGAALVRARNAATAMLEAHAQGCNPGGSIAMWEIPDEVPVAECPEWVNRLMSREEVEMFDIMLADKLNQGE